MGEYVGVTMNVGGTVSTDTYRELVEMAKASRLDFDAGAAAEAGKPVVFWGNRNYGNADEMEEFCRDNNLPYVLAWDAATGAFSGGAHYWQPGMKEPGECMADDAGVPVVSLPDLRRYLESGVSLAWVVAAFDPADHNRLPPLIVCGDEVATAAGAEDERALMLAALEKIASGGNADAQEALRRVNASAWVMREDRIQDETLS